MIRGLRREMEMTWEASGGPGVKTPENQMRKRTGEKI